MKKIIKFIPGGKAISDFEISNYVDKIIKSKKTVFEISTNMVIDEIKARIREKTIDKKDFTIQIWNEESKILMTIDIDKNGTQSEYYKSQDIHCDILMRLL